MHRNAKSAATAIGGYAMPQVTHEALIEFVKSRQDGFITQFQRKLLHAVADRKPGEMILLSRREGKQWATETRNQYEASLRDQTGTPTCEPTISESAMS
jgi:hypothetical protein